MEQQITLLSDQEIHLDLPLSGYRLIPGYSGKVGLPFEIYLRLYAVKGDEKNLIAGPPDLSRFVTSVADENAVWRFLRLFTFPDSHYLFQKDVYTIDLEVAPLASPTGVGMISPETAQRIGYEAREVKLEHDEYITGHDLMRAAPVNSSTAIEVLRRREALSRDGAYRFIEDRMKGEIGRQDVIFPSYE